MKIFRLFTILFVTQLFFLLLGSTTYAMDITTREDLKLDSTLSEEESLFTQPQKIYITQVKSLNKELKNDSRAWVRSIYYYSITRLKLNDIPYNYLVDSSGNVFEGTRGGAGANPGLQGGDNVVLIGILDSDSTLTPRAQSSLVELVETLSYKYGIKEGSWDFVDLQIAMNEGERSYLTYTSSSSSVSQTITQTMSSVRWSAEEHLEYKASIVDVEYPKEIEVGKQLPVKVTIKNENDFTWFSDTKYIYISTADSSESPYAINSAWESFSRPTYIKEKYVKPGDSVEVQFNMLGKSKPGEYKEEFIFVKDSASQFKDSNFEVTFNIIAGEYKLVEVVSPQYGFVNIRECRWYSCAKIEVANDGDVFIMNKKEEGWYEIYYNEGNLGWVSQTYMKEL
ncbi:MAG: hypothetical protein RBT33_00520 [Candidatus Dojkabacteria bacterium]|jgi:hypothetical protein|nr:hypothetical protein [Candidatus Dojkabacteria bacterium]